jgi:hypothetical protein
MPASGTGRDCCQGKGAIVQPVAADIQNPPARREKITTKACFTRPGTGGPGISRLFTTIAHRSQRANSAEISLATLARAAKSSHRKIETRSSAMTTTSGKAAMLESAFLNKLYAEFPDNERKAVHLKANNQVWSYVGRFIMGFARVEYQVNQLCNDLLGPGPAGLFLTYTLDLRKKTNLIEVVLESQGIDESRTFKRVHKFHDIRNVIAHWPFGQDENGLSCDFIDKHGDTNFLKPGTREKDNLIKYSELDAYDAELSELYEKLEHLTHSATPITGLSDEMRLNIEEVISSSDNVVRFSSKLRRDDEGEPVQ